MVSSEVLTRIDAYLDGVPRSVTSTEEIGPFTLFINQGNGWRYYARPSPGQRAFRTEDVLAVVRRQRELSQPLEFEWIADRAPGVNDAAEGAGLAVSLMPLMHLALDAFDPVAPDDGSVVRIVAADDDLASVVAVAEVAFGVPGTEVHEVGVEALPAAAGSIAVGTLAFTADRMREGFTTMAVATIGGVPVASGSHQPREGVTEITGVACLPAFRRRGLGAAVTSALVRDAIDRGVETIFLSAGSEDVAKVYERVGFRTIGRVGAAAFAGGSRLR